MIEKVLKLFHKDGQNDSYEETWISPESPCVSTNTDWDDLLSQSHNQTCWWLGKVLVSGPEILLDVQTPLAGIFDPSPLLQRFAHAHNCPSTTLLRRGVFSMLQTSVRKFR